MTVSPPRLGRQNFVYESKVHVIQVELARNGTSCPLFGDLPVSGFFLIFGAELPGHREERLQRRIVLSGSKASGS